MKGALVSVLIVEPSPDTELQHQLYEKGYDVVWAGDGESALEKLERSRFDALVVSADIEKVDYIELLLSVRQELGNVPIIVRMKEAQREQTKDLPRDDALQLLPETSTSRNIEQAVTTMLGRERK